MSENSRARAKKTDISKENNEASIGFGSNPSQINPIETSVWKHIKKLAIEEINNLEQQFDDIHKLAYDGNYLKFKKLLEDEEKFRENENKNLDGTVINPKIHPYEDDIGETLRGAPGNQMKNSQESKTFTSIIQKKKFNLTPLIFAIWGEEDKNSKGKEISKLIIEHYKKMNINILDIEFYDEYMKKELKHANSHGILIDEDFDQSLEIVIKTSLSSVLNDFLKTNQNYRIHTQRFKHDVCSEDEEVSIIAFSLRLKEFECSKILFDHITEKFSKLNSEELKILENEMHEYLSFNFIDVKNLLDKFINREKKSTWVNLQQIPKFITINLEENIENNVNENQTTTKGNAIDLEEEILRVKDIAFKSFDKMFDNNDFVKSTIISSNIRLPTRIGTENSLEFIQALISTTELKIFGIDLIKYYLQYKWNKIKFLILIQSILIWANIPMITYLAIFNNFNRPVLALFTLVNIILIIFEFLQLISMNIFNYLGNVDKVQACLIARLFLLFLIVFSNSLIYTSIFSCIIYFAISSFIVPRTDKKMKLLAVNSCFAFYIILIFPGFWGRWDSVGDLMMTFGFIFALFFFVIVVTNYWNCRFCKCFKDLNIMKYFNDRINWFFVNWGFRTILLALMIVMIFSTDKNVGIMILTEFIAVICFVTQLYKLRDLLQITKLLLTLSIIIIFPINFSTIGVVGYYFINLLCLWFTITIVLLDLQNFLKKYSKKFNLEEGILLAFILVPPTILGLNIQDLVLLKIFVLIFEFCLLFAFKSKNKIKISILLETALRLIINWNSLDITRIFLCIFWLHDHYSNNINLDLTYALVILILLRGLTGFRCFKLTRYYVRLILHSSKEIFSFLLIFFYTTLSFGAICLVFKDTSPSEIWVYPYDLSIGSPSHDNTFDINYLSFVVATLVNLIVILNLLVSILGDTFDRFQINAEEFDYLEMAETIAEFENMAFYRRIRQKQYSGEYLAGILVETTSKITKGKITRDEFFELKNNMMNFKDEVLKSFESLNIKINETKGQKIGKSYSLKIPRNEFSYEVSKRY